MSLLPTSTYAGPSQADAIWATAGSVGPGGGVTQLVAGSGILLDPGTGDGVVTITATGGGGGGGGVTSILSGGAGMGVSNPDGAVTLTNTGVTSLVAGSGIAVSGSVGAVTVSATALPASSLTFSSVTINPAAPINVVPVTTNSVRVTLAWYNGGDPFTWIGRISNAAWNYQDDIFLATVSRPAIPSGGGAPFYKFSMSATTTPGVFSISIIVYAENSLSTSIPPIVELTRFAGFNP